MLVPERIKRQLLLLVALRSHQSQSSKNVARKARAIVCDYVIPGGLKQNQVSTFTRLVLKEQDAKPIEEFLAIQERRREAWTSAALHLKEYVCTELKREAEGIARQVQTRLGQSGPSNQPPSPQLVQQAWRLLAIEFANRFDGWYRILSEKPELCVEKS